MTLTERLRSGKGADDLWLLKWLAKEDFSHLGECHGKDLDALVAAGLARVQGNAVSVTEAGFALLAAKEGK